jgi:hypothetical protein
MQQAARAAEGAVPDSFVFYFHKELTDTIANLGGSESLGSWSDFIKPEETNFEALCRLSRGLYMVAVIDFLEARRQIRTCLALSRCLCSLNSCSNLEMQ